MLTSDDLAAVRNAMAEALAEHEVRRVSVLPVHLYMPAEGVAFDQIGYITLPAVGATATILSFVVPDGFHGVIQRIGNVYVGGGFTEGSQPPQLQWAITSNGEPVRGYDAIPASLGSTANPSAVAGILIKEGTLIVLQITNNSLVVSSAFSGGRLGGYFYPTSLEPEQVWL